MRRCNQCQTILLSYPGQLSCSTTETLSSSKQGQCAYPLTARLFKSPIGTDQLIITTSEIVTNLFCGHTTDCIQGFVARGQLSRGDFTQPFTKKRWPYRLRGLPVPGKYRDLPGSGRLAPKHIRYSSWPQAPKLEVLGILYLNLTLASMSC